ncbi:MAG: hypothetical protein ABI626_10155 [Sphingomicrobium sp.]
MTRKLLRVVMLGTAPALGGCVAGMAASAVGMAVQSAQGQPHSNAHLKPTAEAQCSARAAQYGTVHIIDVQQYSPSKIIVWGTVDNGTARQSFECGFGTQISGFKLRPIPAG